MRQEYRKPEIKINIFDSEDIMTDSGIFQDGLADATIKGGEASWNAEWKPAELVN